MHKCPYSLPVYPILTEVRTMNEELLARYNRGMLFLTRRQQAFCDGHTEEVQWSDLARISQDPSARRLRDELAKQLGIGGDDFLKDVKFAAAVMTITDNCGEDARQAIFHSRHPQCASSVLKLSRKSREVQRHRVSMVLAPNEKARSLAPQGWEQISDTMTFAKVLSRMERARGSFERGHELVQSPALVQLSADWMMSVRTTVNQVSRVLQHHERAVTDLGVCRGGGGKRKDGQPSRRLALDGLSRQLRMALGLLEKNVRDIPRTSYDVRPTNEQSTAAQQETTRIRASCFGILRAV